MERTAEQLELIRDFVAALRSGEYRQTHSQLGALVANGERAYCCEGVAAERYGERFGFHVKWSGDGSLTINGHIDYAPNDFWRALGIVARVGSPSTSVFTFTLPEGLTSPMEQSDFPYMSLNDDGFTFDQIADLVEWQFLS